MRRLRILTVEDEAPVADSLNAGLVALGHQIVGTAKDGAEAVESASKYHPDLILMDIRMPGIDGIEATKEILAQRAVPIVLLSAYGDEELARRASEAGVMAYLLKPVDLRQLHSTIEVAFARFEKLVALDQEVTTLKEALETRKLVEKAKGIVMERLNLPEAKAFQLLQERSRSQRISLKALASKILEAEDVLKFLGGDS
jgi:response regulator NasT